MYHHNNVASDDFCAENMGKLHTTDPNIGSYNVNCNNINSVITSDREIRVNATHSRAFMGPQRSGYHTMINSNMSNCNNVNSFISGDSTVIRGWGPSTTSDYNVGNINSIINDCLHMAGVGSMADYNVGNINSIINDSLRNGKSTTIRMGGNGSMASFDTDITSDNTNSYTNGVQLNEGVRPSSMVSDTTFLSSNSNNSRTLASKGSGNRLKRFGKLVKKAFKVVTTIGGIFAPSSSSKIQADKNARHNEVTPPPYVEVVENKKKANSKAQPSSPAPAISNSGLGNAPKDAGNSSPVSGTVPSSTTATDFDHVNADHTKEEGSSDSTLLTGAKIEEVVRNAISISNLAWKKQSSTPSDRQTHFVNDGRETFIGDSKPLIIDIGAKIEETVRNAIINSGLQKQSSTPSDCQTYLVYDGRKTLIGGSKTRLTDADIEKAVGDAIASRR